MKKGQSIIELILVFSLLAILLPVLLAGLTSSREGKAQQIQRMQATAVLKETQEALRSIRDGGWSAFSQNGTFHPEVGASKWLLQAGTQVVDGYTTSVVVSDVYRDSAGSITSSGGTLDPSTKKTVTTVSWNTPLPTTLSSTQFFTRFRDNVSQTYSTMTDFQTGVASGAAIVETTGSFPDDGEIILGAGGRGNWCTPSLLGTAVDLPKSGVANAISAIEGQISAVTGENASGVSFANVLVANTNPPTAQILGTFDGYKTNGVFADASYAYIATDNNGKEIVIIDLNQLNPVTKKYAESGYFDSSGNTDANTVYASGSIGYALIGSRLYTFNLTSKTGSRAQLAYLNLLGTGTKLVSYGNYVFISIAGAVAELQIVQVTNGGATLTSVGQADVNGLSASDVALNSTATRAYITTGASASQREFFIIDITSKTGNRPVVGSYDTSGMDPKGIGLATGNRVILVGNGGQEYQVLNIANEAAPVLCGGLASIPTSVRGVSTVLEADGDAYSYIITTDSAAELKMIEGGPGGQFATTGTYISAPFDASFSGAFNHFQATVSEPTQTTLTMQVAVAAAVNGSCTNANYTFIGPDPANPTTSFFTPSGTTISAAIPYIQTGNYVNPGRCFKYKLSMTTGDITTTPVFEDIVINFSP